MKILTVDSEFWWIPLADEIRPERGINVRNMIDSVLQKFRFPNHPTATPAPNEGGLVFERGSFGDINIARMTVYSDGISVAVPSPTSDAETVIKEAIDFFYSLGVRPPTTAPIYYPVSRIVVDFDASIDELLRPIGIFEEIEKRLVVPTTPHLLNFLINADASLMPKRIGGINPSAFRIERRNDIPYEANRYFCMANMATVDHLDVLKHVEDYIVQKPQAKSGHS